LYTKTININKHFSRLLHTDNSTIPPPPRHTKLVKPSSPLCLSFIIYATAVFQIKKIIAAAQIKVLKPDLLSSDLRESVFITIHTPREM
jgi:hypothetical protein